jgi:PAS domain S-box-containing protein
VRIHHFILVPALAMAVFIWISRWIDYWAIPWFMRQGIPDVYLALRSVLIGLLMASIIAVLAILYKSEYERKLRARNLILEETRDFLSRVIEGSAEAIITRDAEGKITSWNLAAERIYGWSASEMVGTPGDQLYPDEEAWRAVEDRRLRLEAGETIRDFEAERVRKNGGRLVTRITTAPLLDGEGRFAGTVGIVRDVTELKEMEDRLMEKERLAAVGELAATVAHEVRNPLAGIRGGCEILLEGYADGDMRHEIGEEIIRQVDRLNNTVHELLLYAKPKVPDPVPTDLHALIDRAIRLAQGARDGGTVKVTTNYDPALPPVDLDPRQVEQVFLNLYLNACQIQGGGGEVHFRTRRDGDRVEVAVRDRGPGIPPERIDTIFKPFYTTRSQGTGLGLAVVKKVVESHGGTVEVSNLPEAGAEFRVYLPLRREGR